MKTIMMTQIQKRGEKLVKKLCCETSSVHYLSILSGTTRGCVWVNNSSNPSLAVVYSYLLGGFQIMGRPIESPEEYASLRIFFETEIIGKFLKDNEVYDFSYSADTDALLDMMRIVFFDKETFEQKQLSYRYRHGGSPSTSAASIKTAYNIIRLNDSFAKSNFDFITAISPEICESYRDVSKFLKNGIGYVALDGDSIIGNVLSNGVYAKAQVLGADTLIEYRRQGVATALLLSAVCDAEKHGYDLIWECVESNIPSVLTAQKCGLSLEGSFIVRWFNI